MANGHAVAMVPGSLTPALRRDIVAIDLADAPTRGLYARSPEHEPHPAARDLIATRRDHLARARATGR